MVSSADFSKELRCFEFLPATMAASPSLRPRSGEAPSRLLLRVALPALLTLCLSIASVLGAVNPVSEDAFASRKLGVESNVLKLEPLSERRSESTRKGADGIDKAGEFDGKAKVNEIDEVISEIGDVDGRDGIGEIGEVGVDSTVTSDESTAPVAKPWPKEFTIKYRTNFGASSGFLAYDWGKRRQIMYHGAGSPFCASLGTDDSCQVFEDSGGTFVYVPSQNECLLIDGEVASLPPEWTTRSEYIGVEEIPGVGLCRGFAFPPTAHVWYETLKGSLPCKFVFPDPSLSFYFEPRSLELGPPDEKYFDLPHSCLSGERAGIERSAV